eukprot:2596964-Rhodomonas_salina.1
MKVWTGSSVVSAVSAVSLLSSLWSSAILRARGGVRCAGCALFKFLFFLGSLCVLATPTGGGGCDRGARSAWTWTWSAGAAAKA